MDAFLNTLEYLNSIPHSTKKLKSVIYKEWIFYSKDNKLHKLEYKIVNVTKASVNYSSEHFYHWIFDYDQTVSHNFRTVNKINNITEFVNEYKQCLDNTAKNIIETNKVKQNIENLIDRHTGYSCYEWAWTLNNDKNNYRIFLHSLKDPNDNNIRLDTKTSSSNSYKSKMITQKQLFTFLKKITCITRVTKKQQEQQKQDKCEYYTNAKSDDHQHNTCNNNNTTNDGFKVAVASRKMLSEKFSHLFISHSKSKRIQYQSCKEPTDCYKYLMNLE